MSWSSPAIAFRKWRTEIERLGILVFLYSLGREAARGFSFASDAPPVIGVSTTWHASVRVFTLFHELGHVLTNTSSSCVEAMIGHPTEDPIERWCESFAASFLMPRTTIVELSKSRDTSDPLSTAIWLSNKLCVSPKSALLRLIETGGAKWTDFRRLQFRYEVKAQGSGGNQNQARTRDVTQRDKYGSCLSTVHKAYEEGLVGEADIRTYLRMYPEELT